MNKDLYLSTQIGLPADSLIRILPDFIQLGTHLKTTCLNYFYNSINQKSLSSQFLAGFP